MSNRILKQFVLIVSILIFIVFGVVLINAYIDTASKNQVKLLVDNVKLEDISKLYSNQVDNNLTFVKKDSNWYVNDKPASNRIVEITLSKLLAIQNSALVSSDSSSYLLYQVSDGNNYIEITTNSKVIKLFVGKKTLDGGDFVRFSDSTSTYSTEKSISELVSNNQDFFRDKTILKVNSADVSEFKINTSTYQFKNNNWTDGSKDLNSNSVSTLFAKLSLVEGLAFANESNIENIKAQAPELSLEINSGGVNHSVSFIKYMENVYAKSDIQDEYIIISSSILDDIEQTILTL